MYLCTQLESCVQLFCDLMDCSPPGSSVHGICQARLLEQIAILFSRGYPQCRDWSCVSCTNPHFHQQGMKVPISFMCLFFCQYHTALVMVTLYKSWTFFFSFSIVLFILGVLSFHIHCKSDCRYVKNSLLGV